MTANPQGTPSSSGESHVVKSNGVQAPLEKNPQEQSTEQLPAKDMGGDHTHDIGDAYGNNSTDHGSRLQNGPDNHVNHDGPEHHDNHNGPEHHDDKAAVAANKVVQNVPETKGGFSNMTPRDKFLLTFSACFIVGIAIIVPNYFIWKTTSDWLKWSRRMRRPS